MPAEAPLPREALRPQILPPADPCVAAALIHTY